MTKQQGEQSLGLHKFRLLRVIGKGSFGKVRIVEHRETGKMYALKYINKATCIGMKAQQNTIRERDILEEIDHPFIVNLRFSFQDEFSMYVVMDLMIGGDLRFHMMRRRFVEGVIKFWIAELACAIDHLHRNHHIVHRDIKPDNILIDDFGHVALTDFNIATRIKGGQTHYSVAGTANYMAPEVVSGVGYTYSIDWWSLGVVMYECVYGKRPFRHKKTNDELKRALLYEEIQFPIIADVQVSFDCISAMRGFLHKDPAKRLGCGSGGFDAIKAHPFFASINWPLLEAKQLDPPFAPNSDQSNFDISHDLEEMLLEPDPLDPKKRTAMKRHQTPPEHDTPEYREIQSQFSAFDYIEYERFKAYIDAHGSIDSLAVDAARAMASVTRRSSASTDSSAAATPTLSQLRLDGRLMIILDSGKAGKPSAGSAGQTPSGSFGRSRTSTTVVASPPQRDSREVQTPLQRTPSFLQLRSPVSSGSSTSLQAAAHSPTSAALLAAMSPNEPCIVEPPACVPIDVATWNQLLPEQQSLAHRYCVKMAHDRRRLDYIEERRARRGNVAGGAAAGAARAVAPSGHRHTPSGSGSGLAILAHKNNAAAAARERDMAVAAAVAPRMQSHSVRPSVDGTDEPVQGGGRLEGSSQGLLTAREKRKSLMKRQHSADNLSLLAPNSPRNGSFASSMRPGNTHSHGSGSSHGSGQPPMHTQQYQQLEMSFSDLPSSALRILPSPFTQSRQLMAAADGLDEDLSEHYLHQPLPPPPPPETELPPPPPQHAAPCMPAHLSPPVIPIPLTPVSAKNSHKLQIPAHLLSTTASASSSLSELSSFPSSPSSSPPRLHII
ncbi:hypothetical protein LPJ53_003664 [Coemansia erecta]|uniref:Kinase-like protein n=1 Tax=Coemansia erecta TaxID=147472 RepID=A0A9W7XVS6_9FUNG|nr:hypothetical protein LPJ53_003664 [Coemansia erecta]